MERERRITLDERDELDRIRIMVHLAGMAARCIAPREHMNAMDTALDYIETDLASFAQSLDAAKEAADA